MREFRALMVGVGGFGAELAAASRSCKYLRVVGACDSQNQAMAEFTRICDARLYPSYEAALRERHIDGVVIATPNDTHRELIQKAASAGKHVFVEKPIANTVADARAIIKATADAGVTLFVGHVARRTPPARMAKKILEGGELGKVVLIEGHIAHRGGMSLTPQTWRWYRDRCPGGPLIQLAVHTVDTFHYFMGPAKSVCAKVARLATPAEIEDTGVIALEYESGALGCICTAYTVPSSKFTYIHGTEAAIFFDRESEDLKISFKTGKTETRVPVVTTNALVEELDEFAKCSLTGAKPETGGPEGLQALAVILAALKSAQEGRTVAVSEVLA